MRDVFAFPNPVNEKAARVVAAGVVLLAAVTLVSGWYWLLVPLAYGFVARVLAGPTLSPLGLLATRVVAPRLGPPREVPGPPKRFAQGMGAVMTVAAALLALPVGDHGAADVLLAAMILAAGLEAGLAFCVGCRIFALLMRVGIVPEAVCADCANIGSRVSQS
jgi:ABC-type phosphate/phosphonate transport system permease subunit